MLFLRFLALNSIFSVTATNTQAPLLALDVNEPDQKPDRETYTFKWPIQKVAIIGAGPGGLVSYRELTKAGFDVKIFERDAVPGGNWHYTDETPVDAPIPNADISVADFVPSLPPRGAQLPYEESYYGEESRAVRRAHRGPKPIWASLKSNAPAPIQQFTELPWPKGSPWELPRERLQNYVRAFASFHGVNSNDHNPDVAYNTRVERVEKQFDARGAEAGWTLTLKRIIVTGRNSSKAIWTAEDFDAVVVATGRYNAPNIPPIAGAGRWADRFPGRLSHSRQYRRPQRYRNQTVLIVGAATSGCEISRDISPHAGKVYQSIRPDNSTLPHFALEAFLRRLPENVTLVPEIKRFRPPASTVETSEVELANGTIIDGIDAIIFATGFRYTFPFLPQYHSSSKDADKTVEPIVTDGTHLRSLYLDIFYIEEPTLGFVDMNVGMQSFTYSEYISVALSKVWAGKAPLPSTRRMWALQDQHMLELGGYGRHFQFLGAVRTNRLIRFFLGWLNAAAVKYGGRQLDGINPENAEISNIWATARFGGPTVYNTSGSVSSAYTSPSNLTSGDEEITVEDYVYSDYW